MGREPVMAHWQFEAEEETGAWQGFSAAVSGSLETAYQQWVGDSQRSSRKPAQIRSGNFIYAVHYTSMLEESKRKSTRIRRISVTEAENAQLCTVDKSLWSEYKSELEKLRVEAEKERRELREASQAEARRVAELEAELQELRGRFAAQELELLRLQQELQLEQEVAARLQRHLSSSLYPGRLVRVARGGHPEGGLARVRSVEGPHVAVSFAAAADAGAASQKSAIWLPQSCCELTQDAELLTRPGTRVRWLDGSRAVQRGVVCEALDGLTADVLTHRGQRQRCSLVDLVREEELRRSDSSALAVGDLVEVASGASTQLGHHHVAADAVGMVVCQDADRLLVRFRGEAPGGPGNGDDPEGQPVLQVDIEFRGSELEGVQRCRTADAVRPGAAVQLRVSPEPCPSSSLEPPAVGIVYALHGDGMAVVDWLGDMGARHSAQSLEVVDPPNTLDFALLRVLSDLSGLQELGWQREEELEERAAFAGLLAALPAVHRPLGLRDFRAAECGRGTELFQNVAALLRCTCGDVHEESSSSPVPSLERVEVLHNPVLQRHYELSFARIDGGGGRGAEAEAVDAERGGGGAVEAREFFLWYSASSAEAAKEICLQGFGAAGRSRFVPGAAHAALRAAAGVAGCKCVLLLRVHDPSMEEEEVPAALEVQVPAASAVAVADDGLLAEAAAPGAGAGAGEGLGSAAAVLPLLRLWFSDGGARGA